MRNHSSALLTQPLKCHFCAHCRHEYRKRIDETALRVRSEMNANGSFIEERHERQMAVATRRWFDDRLTSRHRDSWWGKDDWLDEWHDWPKDWPHPKEMMGRFSREPDHWWRDWPSDWPRMDAVMPRMTSNLDRVDRNWRNDPFWMDIYPRWAEPIFKEGIDVHSNIVNDERRFAVDIDCYQFKPEEIQVKTLDDTLMIEGRHEDVKDRDNFTKMYFVRKYQLPSDVDISQIQSSIDARGRLSVEAPRRLQAITGRERVIPIEGPSRSYQSSPRARNDSGFNNGYSSHTSPIHVNTGDDRGREIRIETNYGRDSRQSESRQESRQDSQRDFSRAESRGADYRDDFNRDRNYLSPDDGYTTHSYSYRRSESRSRVGSPHDVTIANENRAYSNGSPRRGSFDNRAETEQRSPGRGVFAEIRDKFEKGRNSSTFPRRFRSQSRGADVRESSSRNESRREFNDGYSPESRNGYRVDSPASSTTGILKNGHSPRAGGGGESRTESVRSVQILKKTY